MNKQERIEYQKRYEERQNNYFKMRITEDILNPLGEDFEFKEEHLKLAKLLLKNKVSVFTKAINNMLDLYEDTSYTELKNIEWERMRATGERTAGLIRHLLDDTLNELRWEGG